MLDKLVDLMSRVVHDNKELIRTRIAEESPWWVPEVVDDKLYQKIVVGIERTLDDVAANDAHPLRGQFDHALRDFSDKLHNSPEMIARAERMKERLLEHPAVAELSGALLGAALIARTVEGWDATDASRKIEVQIGRDLQFIRINGTLVGGLVGLLLYLVTVFVGGALDQLPE